MSVIQAKRLAENFACEDLANLLKGNVEYDNLESVDKNAEAAKVGTWLVQMHFVSTLHVLLNSSVPLIIAASNEHSRCRLEGRSRQAPDVSSSL